MKLKLFSLILILSSNLNFAGNYFSTPKQEPKIKIAPVEVLKERARKTQLGEDFLTKTKFFDVFADKEITVDDLEIGFTTISNNLWREIKTEIQKEKGTLSYYGLYPFVYPAFNEELSDTKPELLKILLKDDFPDIYTLLLELQE